MEPAVGGPVQTEERLISQAQQGDGQAFGSLYDWYATRVYRYLLLRLGRREDAEDVMSEVFLKAFEGIQRFHQRGVPFSAWLFRIAHNAAVDHLRRVSRRRTLPLEEVEELPAQAEAWDDRLSTQELYRLMARLTPAQREVLSLRFASDLSLEETARAVGKNVNAVKALQHAGVQALRRLTQTEEARGGGKIARGRQESYEQA